ncbi:hypothetical protein ABMA46_02710 [Mesorhizobium sp. CN5-321]|uniref:hypothetical protein n=1 Tax=Mesorhizobium hunchu TaxID=3157708 RepID=UPI0032B79961
MAGRRNLAGLFFLRMRDWLKCRVFPAPLRNHLPPMVTGACLREQSVQVHGSTPRAIDRSQWEQKSTYDSANKVGSHPADASLASRNGQAGDATLSTAFSALRNERFGTMLEKIGDPRASAALVDMRQSDGASADHGSVFAAYSQSAD